MLLHTVSACCVNCQDIPYYNFKGLFCDENNVMKRQSNCQYDGLPTVLKTSDKFKLCF